MKISMFTYSVMFIRMTMKLILHNYCLSTVQMPYTRAGTNTCTITLQSKKTPPQTAASSYYRLKSTPLWQKTYILMVHLWAQKVMECFLKLHVPIYTQTCVSVPVVSLSEPASYTQSRRWPCSQVWLHRCWPDRRLQWYSHWWGSHSYQRQLDDKIEDIWYSEWLSSILLSDVGSSHKNTHSKPNKRHKHPTFRFNHVVVPDFQRLWYC